MTDITIDQLIADLCVCRGKEPRIGTMFVEDCFVTNGAWNLKMTDGTHHFRIQLPGSHEDGDEFDAKAIQQKGWSNADAEKQLERLVKTKAKEIRRRTAIKGWHEDESLFPKCEYAEVVDLVKQAYELGKMQNIE